MVLSVAAAQAQQPDSTSLLLQRDGLLYAPRDVHQAAPHVLRIEADGLYDMSTMKNDLVRGLLRGDVLDRAMRQRSQDALDGNNRAGYVLEGSVSYAWGDSLFGHGGWRPRVAIGQHDVMGLRFADDAYTVTFFGNAGYENGTAHLGPSAFTWMRYQTVAFGAEHVRSGSFIQMAVVNGAGLNSGDIQRADLFTATDGRFLDLDIDGQYWRSDTANAGFLRNNGIGAAISGQWNFFTQLFGHRSTVSVRLDDAGFISWNSAALQVKKDSLVHYEGIRVDDIIDLDGTLIGAGRLQDSLGFGYHRGAFVRPLPAELGAHVRLFANKARRYYDLALDQRYLPGYIPHAMAGATQCLGHWAFTVEGHYGGFGLLRAGVGIGAVLGPHCLLTVHTPNLVGSVSDTARGMAISAGLDVRW